MLARIIDASLSNRILVLALAGGMVLAGLAAFRELPIDAFPDTTPVLVQINTATPNLGPLEIERQVTLPIELALSGLPGLQTVRSLTKFGFSQVTVIFEDGTDLYRARQVVNERLQTVDLPEGIDRPQLGPISTGLGEVFHYLLSSNSLDLRELRTLHDWTIAPILRSVPGVAEINSWGGEVKQYHVVIDPFQLSKNRLGIGDLREALEQNNANVGGGAIVQAGEQILVHGIGTVATLEEIGNIVVTSHDGIPIRVRDVARVEIGGEIRRGAVTARGEGEVLLGLGFMLMGENSRLVASRLEEKVGEIRGLLPEDVRIEVVYNRTELVEKVLHTAAKNLFEGAILVVAVLFALMGNLRAALIVALAIPLSMLFAFSLMLKAGIAGSLLSLGAIDFGIVVDSSVIMVENSVRRAARRSEGRSFVDTIRDACLEVRRPTLFGELIIMVVYLPILTLEGVEGKLFRPMALTVLFCLLGSLILSLTLMPVLASLFLPRKPKPRENPLFRLALAVYSPLLRLALRFRPIVLLFSLLILAATIPIARNLGAEFVPTLSEGSIVINTVRLAGISLEESVRYGTQIEKAILDKFPDEVEHIWTRTGTPEISTDPMGLEVSDIFINLKPRKEWTRAGHQEELVDLMSRELSVYPGMRMVFTQPIEMRMAEMTAGARAEVAVKLFGDDFDSLVEIAGSVDALVRSVPGAVDVAVDQVTGQPVLKARLNQDALAREGVPGSRVLEAIEALGGIEAGEIREGQRRFDLRVRLDKEYRTNPDAIQRMSIPLPDGRTLPIASLVDFAYTDDPSTIQRERGKRRVMVQCNVRGRDVGSFVEDLQKTIRAGIVFPEGSYFEIGGQYEHLIAARQRLWVVVPLALGLVLLLLHLSFHSIRDALLVFTGIPFAIVGGVLSLHLRGLPFTLSAAIGFIALFGIAVLNGLVLVSSARRFIEHGKGVRDSVYESALLRLRPVLATAITDAVGFIPMALSTDVGAEVQRPLATVVIGGVLTSTALTLFVLPVLYSLFGRGGGARGPIAGAVDESVPVDRTGR